MSDAKLQTLIEQAFEDRATITVKVTFGQRECLTDSQAGAP